jgi:hypothetical protein
MDKLIYSLCALTAATVAALLLRGYARTRYRLLLWSGLCFVGLTGNNLLLLLDQTVFTAVDLSTWRLGLALLSLVLLLCGLILDGAE